jgi:hypothetical protein
MLIKLEVNNMHKQNNDFLWKRPKLFILIYFLSVCYTIGTMVYIFWFEVFRNRECSESFLIALQFILAGIALILHMVLKIKLDNEKATFKQCMIKGIKKSIGIFIPIAGPAVEVAAETAKPVLKQTIKQTKDILKTK